jgi:excisionase family DNA binding protein
MAKRAVIEGMAPLGLNREEAAGYVGVAPSTFEAMVAKGVMPEPRMWGSRLIWSRVEVEAAFHNLPRRGLTPHDDGGRAALDRAFGA